MRTEWIIVPLALLLFIGLQGCSPRIIEHTTTVRDTTYITTHQVDSVYFRDSIFVMQKNDTIYQYVEKWRTQYLYRTDTLYQAVRDTTYIREVTEVPRKKTWWDKAKNWIIGILGLGIVFAYRKQILKLITGI